MNGDGPLNASIVATTLAKDQVAVDAGLGALSPAATAALDRSFIRGIAWMGSVKWIVQMVTWGTTIFVARILSPEDYGLLSMASVLLVLISLMSESGIGTTVLAVRDISSAQIAQLNGAAVIIGLVGFAIACAAARPVGSFYEQAALPWIVVGASVTLILTSFRTVPSALLQRELRFPRLAVIEGAQGLVQAIATIALALLGFRYWSLVLGGLIGTLVATAATVVSRPYPLRWPRWLTLRPLLSFTQHILFSRIFWYSYSNSDFIVAGKRLGADALGAYSYAWTLASMPVDKITALVGSVTHSLFAAVQHDIPALRRYLLTITEALAIVTFPFTIGIALVAEELVPAVFGEKWRIMTVPLQVLAAYAAVRTITPQTSQILVVTGDARFQMRMNAVAAIALPLAFYVGSFWGATGIAMAWVIVHPVVILLPLHVRVLGRLGVSASTYFRTLWPAVSGCLCMTGAVLLVHWLLPANVSTVTRLALKVFLGAAVYVSIVLLLHWSRVQAFWLLVRRQSVCPVAPT